jgi:putative transposase
MSRYRLYPTPAQEKILREHCAHARFVWNVAVEQHSWWRPGRKSAPGYLAQCRQLTEARAEFEWLRAGSQLIQQQALRDFSHAVAHHVSGTHGRPTWRKADKDEGFRVVALKPTDIRKVNRNIAHVRIPKAGWVPFRLSRPVPQSEKSFRVTLDRVGRWHIAFAVIPPPISAPANGLTVGVDRGIKVSAALSTGELLTVGKLSPGRRHRLLRLERSLGRCQRGSNRRTRVKRNIAKLRSRQASMRKDWCEKVTTQLAVSFDLIRVEALDVRAMTRSARGTATAPGRQVAQKAALNRGILENSWGMFVTRLDQKAPGRVERVHPAYTSQRCSACGKVDAKARQSQAVFSCPACGHACNADVNAARNIAVGRTVTARGGVGIAQPVNREPQPVLLSI